MKINIDSRAVRFRNRFSSCGFRVILVALVLWTIVEYRCRISFGTRSLTNQPAERSSILFYITTHMSAGHVEFLRQCWPSLLAKSKLYRQADVTMLVTKVNKSHINVTFLNKIFEGRNFRVHVRPNPGYQEGAILGMREAYARNWFQNYTWVIRVNPDVLIRNDSFLLTRFQDPKIHGIFVDCRERNCPPGPGCPNDRKIHTDFIAFRPDSIDKNAFRDAYHHNAEYQATKAFSSIIMRGNDSWLTDVGPLRDSCRVRGDTSPVLHVHDMKAVYPSCLSWYD
jgi:hypothetical protein